MSEIEEMKLKYSINYFGTDSALWNDLQKLFRHISTLEEEMKELQEERDGYKNGQIQLQGMVDDLMDVNAKWVGKVKELEAIERLSRDSIMSEFDRAERIESRLKKLEEAVDRHEIFKRAHVKIVALEDEELYQKRKEV
jgi:SMC interacting uncharacterized protein involved in chromosome segregation